MEALQQRLAKYKDGEEQAKQEGANSKVKRMGRIVKVKNSSRYNVACISIG